MRSALALVATMAGCHGKLTVVQAPQCSDPCCGGQLMSIDCAENPNVYCIEDADPCVAHAYGCADGSYFLTYPDVDVAPSGCVEEGGAGMGGLVLGDGGALSFPDGGDASAEGGDR